MNIFPYFVLIVVIECVDDKILEYESDENDQGYHFKYITSGGQEREETGIYEKQGKDLILRVSGYFSYQGTDGKQYKVTYKADEDGFMPEVNTPYFSRGPISGVESYALRISPQAIASLAGGGLG